MTILEAGALCYEFSRYDSSVAGLYLVQNLVGVASIDQLCSDEQKRRILPEVINMQEFVSFALTEPDFGSDATSLETIA